MPGTKVRFYVVRKRGGFAIVDNCSPCKRKLGDFRDENSAQKIADSRNAEWRRAITPKDSE